MAPEITVLTVNYNSADFIENSLHALDELTHRDFAVHICDNGSRFFDRRKLRRLSDIRSDTSVVWRQQQASHSQAHGTALNLLLERVSSPYALILDADATVLVDGWDELFLRQIDDETKVIGAPPVDNPTKPTDFPSIYLTLVEMDAIRSLDIDMRPKDPARGQDTGWELREKCLDKGIKAACLTTRNTRTYDQGPFADLVCAEFYMEDVDRIVGSHFGRGSSMGAAKYFNVNLPGWYYLTAIPKRIKGYQEKRTWIRTCHALVEEQTSQ